MNTAAGKKEEDSFHALANRLCFVLLSLKTHFSYVGWLVWSHPKANLDRTNPGEIFAFAFWSASSSSCFALLISCMSQAKEAHFSPEGKAEKSYLAKLI